MTIDASGEGWKGSEADDLREYLEALEGTYPIDEFSVASCACGAITFWLEFDAVQGAARRTCTECSVQHFVCDSGEYWPDVDPETWLCVECGRARANISAGFSLYEPGGDVRWIYVGVRCAECGVLGCCVDWKVGYGPSHQLIGMV